MMLYPDTRMCLIWQKLQMLNCCRAGVAAQVELQPPPPSSQSPSPGDTERGHSLPLFFAFALVSSATLAD